MAQNKKLGTYPGFLITISLTLALFLIGFCGWMAFSSKELIKYVRQNVEVQVYLERDISQTEIDSIKTVLESFPELQASDNRDVISFISKESIAQKFTAETKEDYQEILGENPFRDAFSIKLNEDIFQSFNLPVFQEKVIAIKGVYELDYAKDFVDSIISNVNKIYLVLSAIVIIFLIATLLLINNTIKLALYSQRFIIKTMQLVGATNAFVQKPFLQKGIIQGLIAGIIASILIFLTQQLAINQLEGLDLIQNKEMILIISACLLTLGPLIGFLSTFQSISRYLNVDLDDLY